jgi:hypothetical protein
MPDDMERSQPPATSKRKSNKWLWLGALLVALMLMIIGAIYFSNGTIVVDGHSGAFIGTPQSQADGYKLTFGVLIPETKFADCNVVLGINGTHQNVQAINIANGNAFAANNITWTDLNDNGIINKNDSLVVSNPVSAVTYEVVIIWAPGGNSICSQSWTVT